MASLEVSRHGARPTGRDEVSEEAPPARRADWLAGRPLTRADLGVAALLGLAVVAVAYFYRSTVVPTDPWHYVQSALKFPRDAWVPLGYTRYGMILAAMPVAWVFGEGQVSYYFVPFASAGVLAMTMYLLARRWWGWVAGVVAVVLLFSNSIVFYNLSRGYPDMLSMALLMVAVFCALAARDRLLAGRRAVPWLLAVGFCLGWGFEARETSMLAWPVFAVILWVRGRLLWSALVVAVPLAFWALLDIGISAWAYGDPWLKYHTLTGIQIAEARTDTGEIASNNVVNRPRWYYLSAIPLRAWAREDGLWIVGMGALSLVGLVVRQRAVRLFAGWFVVVYLLNVLAAGALDPSRPRGRLDITRYWIQYLPVTALVTGALVGLAGAWLARRLVRGRARLLRSLPAAALGVLVCWGPTAYLLEWSSTQVAFAPHGGDALEDLRDHLRGRGFAPELVWTDWETARILPVYQRDFFGGERVWSGTPASLTGGGTPRAGDYVVLFSARSQTCTHCRNALRPWLREHRRPPAGWKLEYATEKGNLMLYRVT